MRAPRFTAARAATFWSLCLWAACAVAESPIPCKPDSGIPCPADALTAPVLTPQLTIATYEAAQGNPKWVDEAAIPRALVQDGALGAASELRIEVFSDPATLAVPIKDLITSLGGHITEEFTAYQTEAQLAPWAIGKLAAVPGIVHVRLARVTESTTVSQARQHMKVDFWNRVGRVTGFKVPNRIQRVRIAIIDRFDATELRRLQNVRAPLPNEFVFNGTSVPAPLEVSEAPADAQIVARPRDSAPGALHGTKMLQVINDFARDAEYVLIDRGQTVGDARNALRAAMGYNPDVLNISFRVSLDGYGDGSTIPGSVGEILRQASYAGTVVVMAAGNAADGHWGGLFEPMKALPARAPLRPAPLPADPNTLNWNRNYFLNGSPILADSEPNAVNIIAHYDGSECIAPSDQPIELLATREVGVAEGVNTYGIRLLRQGAQGTWYTVAYSAGTPLDSEFSPGVSVRHAGQRAIHYQPGVSTYHYGSGDSIGTQLRTAIGDSPGCPAGTARYGAKVQRRLDPDDTRPTGGDDPFYLNVFVHGGYQFKQSVPQASIASPADLPQVVTVGATYCNPPEQSAPSTALGCQTTTLTNYSSQGPVLGALGTRPTVLAPAQLLNRVAVADDPIIKPNLVAASHVDINSTFGAPLGSDPPARSWYELCDGTSCAAAHVSGLAALLVAKFPHLRGNSFATKNALHYLASLRHGDAGTTGDYTVYPTYRYGRGKLMFQNEGYFYLRGRFASTCPFDNMKAVPRYGYGMRPLPAFPDGAGAFPYVAVLEGRDRLHDDYGVRLMPGPAGQHVLYPVLSPRFKVRLPSDNGTRPESTRYDPTDLFGGNNGRYTPGGFYFFSAPPLPGYFTFNNDLSIVRLPPSTLVSGTRPNLSGVDSYSLEIVANDAYGREIPTRPGTPGTPNQGQVYFPETAVESFSVRHPDNPDCRAP